MTKKKINKNNVIYKTVATDRKKAESMWATIEDIRRPFNSSPSH